MTSTQKKKIPTFSDEAAERDLWAREDSADYIDWSQATRATLPKLRATPRMSAMCEDPRLAKG